MKETKPLLKITVTTAKKAVPVKSGNGTEWRRTFFALRENDDDSERIARDSQKNSNRHLRSAQRRPN
jgi:hypothetical protein